MEKYFKTEVVKILSALFILFAGQNLYAVENRIKVSVSIQPLKYLTEKIGGDRVAVNVSVPPGANPHSYEPKPKDIVDFSRSEIFVKTGTALDFEVIQMKKLLSLNKSINVINSSSGIDMLKITGKPGAKSEGHVHNEQDPHIWASIKNNIVMAENIKKALVKRDPENGEFYSANFNELKKYLSGIDAEIS